jgi:hypothetical protein
MSNVLFCIRRFYTNPLGLCERREMNYHQFLSYIERLNKTNSPISEALDSLVASRLIIALHSAIISAMINGSVMDTIDRFFGRAE